MAVGKNITWKMGSNNTFPLIWALFGRISEEKWKGTDISGRKSRFKKMGMGKNILSKGTLWTPGCVPWKCIVTTIKSDSRFFSSSVVG